MADTDELLQHGGTIGDHAGTYQGHPATSPRVRASMKPQLSNRRAARCEAASKVLISFGGAKGSRTPDLLNAIQALSQLSYGPGRAERGL